MIYSVEATEGQGVFAIIFEEGTHTIFVKKIGDKFILSVDESLPTNAKLIGMKILDAETLKNE